MRQKLGQHFLKSDTVAKKIAAALTIENSKEVIIEIGPGHGELTGELANRVKRVGDSEKRIESRIVAIEKDPELVLYLRKRFAQDSSVEIIEGDALEVLPRLAHDYALNATRYTLTGNLPYYLTGFLFRTIGELEHKPARTVFMIQKEVAERIVARPPRMNRLSAAVQYWAEPKLLFTVGRDEFSPAPDVDSAVIRLDALPPTSYSLPPAPYYRMLHILFQQPRKTLLNNLAAGFPDTPKDTLQAALLDAGIAAKARPQDLDLDHIVALSKIIDPGTPSA